MKYYAVVDEKTFVGPITRKEASIIAKEHRKYRVLSAPAFYRRYGEPVEKIKVDVNLFQPDIYALEEEWQNQPKLFFSFADKLAQAKSDHAKAEAALDLVTAELDLDIRNRPESFGIKKIAEKAISHCIVTQERYKKCQSRVFELKHLVDLLQGAVTACDHRKKALEKAVDLWLAGYFAEPRGSKASHEQVEEFKRKSATSGLRRKKK